MVDRVKLVCTEGGRSEVLWVEALGGDRFRIDNVPAIVTTLSMGDVVTGALVRPGVFKLGKVVELGGHTTIHLLLADPESKAHEAALADLAPLGCTIEMLTLRLIGLDVARDADLAAIEARLAEAAASGVWTVTVVNRQHA